MSVAATVTLPAQHSAGSTLYVPLGGNGMSSPHAMYVVKGLNVTGDASGGQASMTIIFDDRFCSMVGYASVVSSNTAVDPAAVRWVLTGSQTAQAFRAALIAENAVAGPISDTWLPPPVLTPGGPARAQLSVTLLNETTITSQMYAQIFIYNINARQRVPFEYLVAARGGV